MKRELRLENCENLFDVLVAAAADAPDHVFCRQSGLSLTRAGLLDRARLLAQALLAGGLVPGDRVAVMLENSLDYIALVFGLAKARLIWVPVNTRLRGEGLTYLLAHAEVRCVVAEEHLRSILEFAVPDSLREVVLYRGKSAPLLAQQKVDRIDRSERHRLEAADRFVCISYTSGTTGQAKGVLVTHRMLAAASQAVIELADARDGDSMVMWEPLYHIGGSQLLLLPLYRRLTLTLIPKFSGATFLSTLRDAGATHLHYLGGILSLLLKQPPRDDDKAHSIRIAWGGGAPRKVWRPFEERFGMEIRECYGMTETSSIVTCNFDGPIGSIGKPLPWFEASIETPRGRSGRPGERGEIVVRERAPGLLFCGYFKDETTTLKALRDGALHTGDIGSQDQDGNFYFHGRMSDSVRTKGENVSAFEVEHVIAQHPDIEECAMIGIPSELGDQEIKIFVKVKHGRQLAMPILAAWCADRMASFQIPRYFAHISSFEKTPSERIKKHTLSQATEDSWDRLS